MKKLIIAVSQLRVGGVAKALIELLRNIENKYDITLICFDHSGAFFDDIPKSVMVVKDNPYLSLTERAAGSLSEYGKKYKIIRQVCSLWTKIFNKKLPAKYICRKVGQIEGEYDVAIAFGHPQQKHLFCNLTGEVILNCVSAKKKVIVIHCDYELYGGHCKCNDKLLLQFDKIAAVSKSVGEAVIRCIPQAKDKICTLRNFHDFETIQEMSLQAPVEYPHKHTIITVARLSEEKGLTQSIGIVKALKEKDYDIEWHIVGDGPLKGTLAQLINENNAGDYIVLEGEQTNPYRYIKKADYLLVPSLHEAAPMVFDEAACLGVPIVSTETLSAKEMVEGRELGYVCEADQLLNTLKIALDNQEDMKQKVTSHRVNNEVAFQDIEDICDD